MEPTDEQIIRRLYEEEQLSWREIGVRLGTSERTARRRAVQLGIETRPPGIWTERSRSKLAAAKTGKKRAPFSDEARANMSAAQREHVVSEGQRELLRQLFTGRTFSEESRRRMSEGQRRKAPPSESSNLKRSETMTRRWQEPGARERWRNVAPGRSGRDNYRFGVTPPLSASKWHLSIVLPNGECAGFRSRLEAIAAHALSLAGIVWEYERHRFELASVEGTYAPDFFLPDLNCFVEIGGKDGPKKKHKRACFRADHPGLNIAEWDPVAVRGLARGTVTVCELLADPRAGRGCRRRIAPPITLQIVSKESESECIHKS